MIAHAMIIIMNELEKHLLEAYKDEDDTPRPQLVGLGNASDIAANGSGGIPRDMLYLSLVQTREEKTLKNLPNRIRDDAALTLTYENPPVYLNFLVLLTAPHQDYTNALSMLSRAIRFFQYKNVFTQDNVDPGSLSAPRVKHLDILLTFKLILDLYSPTMEEVNHLWGTLGGKQYPFVLYMLRMLELQFRATQSEGSLITEIVSDFNHKKSGMS